MIHHRHGSDPKTALGEALEYLIQNAYPKMGYIQYQQPNPKQEIQSLLRANDVEQTVLVLNTPEGNPEALNDLREYLRLAVLSNRQIVLYDLINKRYGDRPYGWPELEVVLLVARLVVLKEIELMDVSKVLIPQEQAYDHLTAPSKQRKVLLQRRETADTQLLKEAQTLGKALWGQIFPDEEDGLFRSLQGQLLAWDESLSGYETLANTGYPGGEEIRECRQILRPLVAETNSLSFLKRFVGNKNELQDLEEDYQDLNNFYTHQRHSWEQLRFTVQNLSQNRLQLESHPEAGAALSQMETILKAKRPYSLLNQVSALKDKASTYNTQLVGNARQEAMLILQSYCDQIEVEVTRLGLDATLRTQIIAPLDRLIKEVEQSGSIAHIRQAQTAGELVFDQAMALIEKALQAPVEPGVDNPPKPIAKPRRVVEVKRFCSEGFIETPEQMDQFLTALRQELQMAIAAGQRIQIK